MTVAAPHRIRSLDALRGFDLFWIVGGAEIFRALQGVWDNALTRGVSAQLEHAEWYGLHFYDTIFPLFLFLVGIGVVLSVDQYAAAHGTRAAALRIVRRAVLIYVLGVLFNGGVALGWAQVRWIGVLQEIGACYLLAGLLYLALGRRVQAVAIAIPCLLLLHWGLLTFIPFPDLAVTPEALDPLFRQLHTHDPAVVAASIPTRIHGVYGHAHNFANYLDFRFLPGKKPEPYFAWEGLLSPLSACTLCLLGILAGRHIKNPDLLPGRKLAYLLAAAAVLLVVGLLWSREMPIVKKLWSGSFCLVAGAYCSALLAGFYWLVDLCGCDRWCAFLVWIGANPITIYLLSGLVHFRPLAIRLVGNHAAGFGGLLVALVAFVLLTLVAHLLYRRSIFLRL